MPTTEQVLKDQAARAVAERNRPVRAKVPEQLRMQLRNSPAAPPQPQLPTQASSGSNAVAVPDTRTAHEQYLDEVAPAAIVGELIKFKDGQFIVVSTEETIADDTDFVALVDQTLVGWIRFHGDEPPTRVMGLFYDDFVPPPRAELGDTDETQWNEGLDGRPEDPWQHQMCLVLQRVDSGALYTFSTQSKTGRRAVANLLRHYDRLLKTHPDTYPIIRLKKSGFAHRDERIGWVPTPAFAVVGRVPKDSAAKPDSSIAADLDDALPGFA